MGPIASAVHNVDISSEVAAAASTLFLLRVNRFKHTITETSSIIQ